MSEIEQKEVDELSGTATTGHEWDGIKELDTPMPRWWLITFYATIVFAIGYMIYYPAIPLIHGNTPGISGYTNRGALKQEMQAVDAARQAEVAKIEATSLEDIVRNDELKRYAQAGGASLFKVYCVQCHGSGAQGSPGYPNLNDDDWLWGGSLEQIYTTISHGIRSPDDDDTHTSEMPAFGKDDILDKTQINDVAEFVLKLSGQEANDAEATKGQAIYADNCASCHGEKGQGSTDLGAPNLSDKLWLYGNSKADIVAQISNPRHGVMPAWGAKLGDANVKQLTVYVHELGGGQ